MPGTGKNITTRDGCVCVCACWWFMLHAFHGAIRPRARNSLVKEPLNTFCKKVNKTAAQEQAEGWSTKITCACQKYQSEPVTTALNKRGVEDFLGVPEYKRNKRFHRRLSEHAGPEGSLGILASLYIFKEDKMHDKPDPWLVLTGNSNLYRKINCKVLTLGGGEKKKK